MPVCLPGHPHRDARRPGAGPVANDTRALAEPVGPGRGRIPAEGEGVEPSRLIARPSSSRVPSPFGLPSRPCSTGGRNRTCELLFNREAHEPAHATPVRISVGAAGFEPALSWSRTRRIRQPFPRPESSSAQRESNPHFRHGEAVGDRYIMGTIADAELSKKPRAPGGTRTHVAALRVRGPRRWTTGAEIERDQHFILHPSAFILARCEWDQRGSNPHTPVKSRVCCR